MIIPWKGNVTTVLSRFNFALSRFALAALTFASASFSWGILSVRGFASPIPNSFQSRLASSLSAISLSNNFFALATFDSAEITANW